MLAPLARVARRAMEARTRASSPRASPRASSAARAVATASREDDGRGRVVVVGGGAAGVACARALAATREVTLFDGGRAPGGRASTREGRRGAWEHGARFVDVERERERERDDDDDDAADAWMRDRAREGAFVRWEGAVVALRGGRAVKKRLGARRTATPSFGAVAKALLEKVDLRASARVVGFDASDVDGAGATKAVIRIDGYRLLKMLLSVFVDTTPPADAFVGKPIKTQSKASRREAATRDLSSAMETVEVRPKPKLPPAAVATAKPEPSPTPSAEATKEIALYHATLRAAVTDAVGKYAAALFPKEVPKQSIDEAQTKLDALAQDLLTKIIDDDAEIVDEAPMACKSYARAKESIRQGLGTPGAESPAVGASSTRDVARAILAAPAIKRAVEPMLKVAVQSVKMTSATNRPVPVPRMDREPEPSL